MLHAARLAGLVLGVVVGGGDALPSAASRELSEGQVVLAFQPQLSGDPAADFTRAVRADEIFTVYLIAGPLPVPTRGLAFSLGISEAVNVLVSDVRSFGRVFAGQNSIGTFVSISVTLESGCLDHASESVLAEIDLARQSTENPVQIRLGGANYDQRQPPEYLNCHGAPILFDDSVAQQLVVEVPGPVPVSPQTWSTVKDLYRSP